MGGAEKGPQLESVPQIIFSLSNAEEEELLRVGSALLRHRHKEEEKWTGQNVRADGPNGTYDIRIESVGEKSDDFPQDRDYAVTLIKRADVRK